MGKKPATAWLDGLTIGEVLRETTRRFADCDAIIFPESGVKLNYREYAQQIRAVGKGLLALGIKPGEHVGIWATNIPQWVLLQHGAASVGIVLVTINPAYRPFELSYTIEQSDIVALFLTDQFKSSNYYDIFEEVCPEITQATGGAVQSENFPKLRYAGALKKDAPKGFLPWQSLLDAGRSFDDEAYDAISAGLKADDVINIQYTSGTTGFPKAAMLTHRNILMNAWHVTGCQRISEHDRMCVPVPFYHCFGCVMGSLGALTRGAALVIPAEYFNPADTLRIIAQEKCTTLYGVPTMFVAMLDHEALAVADMSSLRSGIMAGSPCPIEVMKKVIDVMGCSEITIAYGQTETAPVLTQSHTDDAIDVRVETVGRALPGVEIEIRDPETGKKVPDNTQGELCARGHGIMKGYYNNVEATNETIVNGWVHTGDLAVKRHDNNFKITGRLKDMVIRGGENIYPREIEEFLFSHPAIAQAAVFGLPDVKFGEELCAWIQLHENASLNEEEIRNVCKKNLAHYKVPRYIKLVKEFPTTVSGKIQKFKMREQMCEALNLCEQKTA
jgi:fatty-acyl-CoA synthase